MALLGDAGHLEYGLGLFGDSVRQLHDLPQTYPRHRNPFGRTQWYS
jgi:hypothetical protein